MDHSEQNKGIDHSFNPIENTPFIGCYQVLPVLFFLLIFITICLLSLTDEATLKEISNFDGRAIGLFILIASGLIGLFFGFASSILFFLSMSNKKIKTLNRGILFNIIAWVFLSITLLIFIILLVFIP